MSYISEEELKAFLGKQLNDEYGRNLGRVIGLRINDYGQLRALEVAKENGNLAQYPLDLITIDQGSLFLLPDWKVSSETVQKELDRVVRRMRALSELLQEHQIPVNIYDELKRKQEETLKDLSVRKGDLTKSLEERIGQLDKQIDELIRFLVNVKMEYRAGLIDENALSVACDAIEPNLKPILDEKKEISQVIANIGKVSVTGVEESNRDAVETAEATAKNAEEEQRAALGKRSNTGPIQVQLEG